MQDSENDKIIKNIYKHQANDFLHGLTCGVDSNHALLLPKEIDGKVWLVCPDCDYIQKVHDSLANMLSKSPSREESFEILSEMFPKFKELNKEVADE